MTPVDSNLPPPPLRLGISACLLGKNVRFDGGHKHDRYLTDTLGRWVEWVAVCPEVGSGLPTPRPSLRLVGDAAQPRLVIPKTGEDHTAAMHAYARREVKKLQNADLAGFILKSKSPSCGLLRVKVYSEAGMPAKAGSGLFAAALRQAMPLLPIEEEGRLHDPKLREMFLEQVFTYQRWLTLLHATPTPGNLVAFHTAHKFLILAHDPTTYTELGHLVAHVKEAGIRATCDAYGTMLMQALRRYASVRKHTNVLQHLAGFFKKQLPSLERRELASVIGDYHSGLVPLIVPITLIRHYVRCLEVPYLAEQVYLEPTPKELMLRNHV